MAREGTAVALPFSWSRGWDSIRCELYRTVMSRACTLQEHCEAPRALLWKLGYTKANILFDI